MSSAKALAEKIASLPPERVAEVELFVDFLITRAERKAAFDRFLAIAPAMEAAGVPPMSEDEIMAEIRAVRAERQARQPASDADRS